MTFRYFLKDNLRQLHEYWLALVLIVLGAAVLEAFPGWLIIRLAKIALYGLAVIGIPITVAGQKLAMRAWGSTLGARTAMLQLSVDSQGANSFDVVFMCMKVGATLVISALVSGGGWLSLGCYVLSVGITNYIRLCAPPFAIFLGKSTDRSRRLADNLAQSVVPHRLVHLLSFPDNDPSKASMLNIWVRRLDDKDWATAVQYLMANARVIVVDGREETESLISEVGMILSLQLLPNTIFVCDERGRCNIFASLVSRDLVSTKLLICVAADDLVLSVLPELAVPQSSLSTHPILCSRWQTVEEIM